MVRIKSKKAGFRRCGVAHSAEAVEYPDTRFSDAEIAALKADPMLIVEEVEGWLASKPASKGKGKK